MRLGIVGSRGLSVDIGAYVTADCTLIVSGGAKGIDACAADFARAKGIPLVEYNPDYARYGRGDTLRRNDQIADFRPRVFPGRVEAHHDA